MILIQLKGKNTGFKNLLIKKAAKSPEIFDVRKGESPNDGSSSSLEGGEFLSPPMETVILNHTVVMGGVVD